MYRSYCLSPQLVPFDFYFMTARIIIHKEKWRSYPDSRLLLIKECHKQLLALCYCYAFIAITLSSFLFYCIAFVFHLSSIQLKVAYVGLPGGPLYRHCPKSFLLSFIKVTASGDHPLGSVIEGDRGKPCYCRKTLLLEIVVEKRIFLATFMKRALIQWC